MERIFLKVDAYPPTANKIWRKTNTGRVYLNPETERFNKAVSLALMLNGTPRAPEDWEFFDVYIILHPARRSGDVDNRIKPILDALTKCGFWKDDKQVGRVACEFGTINKKPFVNIIIKKRSRKYLEIYLRYDGITNV